MENRGDSSRRGETRKVKTGEIRSRVTLSETSERLYRPR